MVEIKYTGGYKYQLNEKYSVNTPCRPIFEIGNNFTMLFPSGDLHIMSGYAWDGASGPVPDTKNIIRASLVHDAMYQLMREGLLSSTELRKTADEMFYKIAIEDGTNILVAKLMYQALRIFGEEYTKPG